MTEAGIEKPAKNWEAHHLIPENDPCAKDLWKNLSDAKPKIDRKSAANGVWLPRIKGQNVTDILDETTQVKWRVSTHKYHTQAYLDFVAERLEHATTTDEILHELHEIRKLLLSGKLELGLPKT